MKPLLLIIGSILGLCQTLLAGGDSFLIEIVSLTPKSNGEYKMEFIQHGAPYTKASEGEPKRVIAHLRYEESIFGEGTAYTSRQNTKKQYLF